MRMMTRCNGLLIVQNCHTRFTLLELRLKTGRVVSFRAKSLGHAIELAQLPRAYSLSELAYHTEAILEVEGGFLHLKDTPQGVQLLGATASLLTLKDLYGCMTTRFSLAAPLQQEAV